MSKPLLLFIILFASIASKAQLSKGKISIGGIGGYSYQTIREVSEATNSSFYLTPTIGRFYKNNRLAGLLLSYSYYASKGTGTSKTNSVGAGFFLRQYKPLGKSFFVFADESLRADFSNTKNSMNPEFYNKIRGINASFKPGIAYQLTKCMQLELLVNNVIAVGYNETKQRITNVSPERVTKSFSIRSDLNLNVLQNTGIGFRFIF